MNVHFGVVWEQITGFAVFGGDNNPQGMLRILRDFS
jgi:hypothetical protein